MKIAIFGGSFNPIHNAHIKLALRFVDEIGLDKVFFVPTFLTPLKDNYDVISAQHRFNMCEIAISDYEYFHVSDIEISRQGLSYSSDTIAHFKQLYPTDDLYFILGADMFLTLERWHNFKYIFESVTLLTAPRNDCDYAVLSDKASEYQKYCCKAYITKNHIEDLSSTMIRDMITNGEDLSLYVDKNVLTYIVKNNLYR